jgi:hypothetical protein
MRAELLVMFQVVAMSGLVPETVTAQSASVCQIPLDVGMDLAVDVEETAP